MNYKPLGNTGLLVSELCLGTMTFGGTGFWEVIGAQGQELADRLVAQAIDAGVNFFDTANIYSTGESETILGAALKEHRHDVVVATKVRGRMRPGANSVGLSRAHIMEQVDASLARLGTDYIDLYQIHGFDALTPLEETLRTMDDLVTAGKVRYIGCSNLAAWQLAKALGISGAHDRARFESLQAYYTVEGRGLEREVVPLLTDQRVGLMVWSPLGGGLLSDKFRDNQAGPADARRTNFDFPPVDRDRLSVVLEALHVVAERHGVSIAQTALAWLLHKEVVTSVIIGAKRPEQLAENLACTEIALTPEDMAELDAAAPPPPEYPGWMLEFQSGGRFPDEA